MHAYAYVYVCACMCWVVGACSGAEGEQRMHPPCSNPGEPRMHMDMHMHMHMHMHSACACADSDEGAAKLGWRGAAHLSPWMRAESNSCLEILPSRLRSKRAWSRQMWGNALEHEGPHTPGRPNWARTRLGKQAREGGPSQRNGNDRTSSLGPFQPRCVR